MGDFTKWKVKLGIYLIWFGEVYLYGSKSFLIIVMLFIVSSSYDGLASRKTLDIHYADLPHYDPKV